jgi:hypothetical protein
MNGNELAAELRDQLRERPYWTTAALVGAGWILGRSLPLGVLVTAAGIGVRVAVATALENVVRDRMGGGPGT